MTRVVFAPLAREHARRIDAWWRVNRPAVPDLFTVELSAAVDQLTETPLVGGAYSSPLQHDVRRLLLPKTRYHVYYSFEPSKGVVRLRAIWHAARGHGPEL